MRTPGGIEILGRVRKAYLPRQLAGQSALRSTDLPLEISADVIWNAIAVQAQDVDIGHHACFGVLAIATMTAAVRVDGFVEAEQCWSGIRKVRPHPALRWAAENLAEIAVVAGVPVPIALASPPRIVKKLPTVVPARPVEVRVTNDPALLAP